MDYVTGNSHEKKMLEKAAVNLFISCYKDLAQIEYKLIRLQERPDAIIEDSLGNRLGLEVAHLFYDKEEAKLILGRADREPHNEEHFERLLKELNYILDKKRKKRAGYLRKYPCSLLIRNLSALWTKEDFIEGMNSIKAPMDTYKDIWLLTKDDWSEWNLIKLD